MNENNKVQKLKTCPICIFLENDEDLSIKVNSLLKTTDKITPKIEPLIGDLITSKNLKTPSAYNLNKHKNDCLKDFEISLENVIVDNVSKEILIKFDIDMFDNMSTVEKDIEYRKILHRIYYKQLLNIDNPDKSDKRVFKEEITTLKILNDLININNIDVSTIINMEDIKDKHDVEVIGIKLINLILSKGLINSSIVMDIAKLLVKNGNDMECFNKEHINKPMSREEMKEFIDKTQNSIEFLEYMKLKEDGKIIIKE